MYTILRLGVILFVAAAGSLVLGSSTRSLSSEIFFTELPFSSVEVDALNIDLENSKISGRGEGGSENGQSLWFDFEGDIDPESLVFSGTVSGTHQVSFPILGKPMTLEFPFDGSLSGAPDDSRGWGGTVSVRTIGVTIPGKTEGETIVGSFSLRSLDEAFAFFMDTPGNPAFADIRGDVSLRRLNSNLWKPMSTTTLIASGDTIRTDRRSSILFRANNHELELLENAEMVIEFVTSSNENQETDLRLLRGPVRVKTLSTAVPNFFSRISVITPTLKATLRGSEMTVIVDDETSEVFVTDDMAFVETLTDSGQEAITLFAGSKVEVKVGSLMPPPEPFSPAALQARILQNEDQGLELSMTSMWYVGSGLILLLLAILGAAAYGREGRA